MSGPRPVGVTPDIITFAKAVTNGIVPFGGVIVRQDIHDAWDGANTASSLT